MLRGGGGSHGGNGVRIFGYEKENHHIKAMDRAIDKFHNNNASVFAAEKFHCSGNCSNYGFDLWPINNNTTQDQSRFVIDHHGVLGNDQEKALKWTTTNFNNQNPTLCLNKDNNNKNAKVVRRRSKKESSVILIKGQWTDEEDRLLLLFFFFG